MTKVEYYRVKFKKHSTTSVGFDTLVRGKDTEKKVISIHNYV
jgi:hypothetical protein